MKSILCTLSISLICMFMYLFPAETSDGRIEINERKYNEIISIMYASEHKIDKPQVIEVVEENLAEEIISEEQQVTEEDIWLIAWITMGEAEGECEEGKRLVIDTILNRVDHRKFPNSIHDVIYQPSQFSCVWNGRLDRTSPTEEVCQLVREELTDRLNSDVVYFTAGGYGKYGEHLFQCGNHYFCGE